MENDVREPRRQVAISIGKRLKEAREKKSLTIDQIQKQTKIHSTVLIALEEGRADEILTETYVRSFLKKYTQILGLPVGDIFKEYFPPHPEQLSVVDPIKESPLPEETKIGPKVLYTISITVAVILILFVVSIVGGKIIASFNKAKPDKQRSQPAVTTPAKKKAVTSEKPAQKKKTSTKANSESKDIIPRNVPLSLVIKVKEPVLVKLTKDGVRIFATVLSKDLVETITAKESIELEISKARALELTLNGRQIALPTKNKIFTLVITRKGVKLK